MSNEPSYSESESFDGNDDSDGNEVEEQSYASSERRTSYGSSTIRNRRTTYDESNSTGRTVNTINYRDAVSFINSKDRLYTDGCLDCMDLWNVTRSSIGLNALTPSHALFGVTNLYRRQPVVHVFDDDCALDPCARAVRCKYVLDREEGANVTYTVMSVQWSSGYFSALSAFHEWLTMPMFRAFALMRGASHGAVACYGVPERLVAVFVVSDNEWISEEEMDGASSAILDDTALSFVE